jgi:hypothetical protein
MNPQIIKSVEFYTSYELVLRRGRQFNSKILKKKKAKKLLEIKDYNFLYICSILRYGREKRMARQPAQITENFQNADSTDKSGSVFKIGK